jgi:3-methyladenine DNA glycosylase Tag
MRKGEAEKPPQQKERVKQARPEKKVPELSTAMAKALAKSGFRANKGKGSR